MRTTSPRNRIIERGSRRNARSKHATTQDKRNLERLRRSLADRLSEAYYSEMRLLETLPSITRIPHNDDLTTFLEEHLKKTRAHVSRCESAFEAMGLAAKGRKCEGMDDLLKAVQGSMTDTRGGAPMDATLIAAARKVEHYEVDTYATMLDLASQLGLTTVSDLLGETLREERMAERELARIAEKE